MINQKIFGGILLVSGTTIGAAMLAMPVVTGLAGWFPGFFLMIATWLYLTYTAFLFLEVNLAFPQETDMITMAKKTVGRWGEVFAWVTYLFLLYALNTAYLAGGSSLIGQFLEQAFSIDLPLWSREVLMLCIFGFVVIRGTYWVDRVNRLCMLGVLVCYFILNTQLVSYFNIDQLSYQQWPKLHLSISVVVTSFGFHIIIPTLSHYMRYNIKDLKITLWVGCLLPVFVFAIWNTLALGVVPIDGPTGIHAGYQEGLNAAQVIARHTQNPLVMSTATGYAIFAILTSFLGVSISLVHFLSDGLSIKRTAKGKVALGALTFIPPLVLVLTDPRAFLNALEYAGAFGVATLLGFLPAVMAWKLRYKLGIKSPFQAWGGKLAIGTAIILSIAIVLIELCHKLGCFNEVLL